MSIASLFFGLDTIGFSGSRSLSGAGLAVLASVFPLVPVGCHVVVGCAAGADLVVRSAFGDGDVRLCVFAVDSGRWGVGRAAFARRSVAIVEAVPPGGLLVVVPGSISPGGGSGSWGSAALALGTGRRVLLWLPSGAVPPIWAGVSWVAIDGWWLGVNSSSQLSFLN
jgi:hypothetical protein